MLHFHEHCIREWVDCDEVELREVGSVHEFVDFLAAHCGVEGAKHVDEFVLSEVAVAALVEEAEGLFVFFSHFVGWEVVYHFCFLLFFV